MIVHSEMVKALVKPGFVILDELTPSDCNNLHVDGGLEWRELGNSDQIDAWLFEHAQIMGHKCDSIKGGSESEHEGLNIAWRDTVTDETINIVYAVRGSTMYSERS